MIVICDSSALIALQQIGHLDLLQQLFGAIVIPQAVAREIEMSVEIAPWIEVRRVSQLHFLEGLQTALGAGEREAIALAQELDATHIVLDDRAARRAAQFRKLHVVGTLALLVAAKNQGFLPRVKPALDALEQHHFHIAPALYETVLESCNEAD